MLEVITNGEAGPERSKDLATGVQLLNANMENKNYFYHLSLPAQ